ncbi:hypothetical protein Pst134EA_015805 [Puccinia striiformis f. sp. tritici]|uniref:Transmembrane protein 135 N-terminal domain-containing protein n=1 Tax=Puccinia striiformis f. sp. tritici PST-78 TaxID=1165861 RepID=A0A0L0VFN1_9BASI|nr:hypothetical protein Pst134EA_015805 [Puccinia striiformis f. sp. tritici]KAH9463719.1 hypothetical protein Pst134EA_015805 [Puccinia striiformis f. sp. tritici]KNE97991.1 hypothetical protein PSTG_08666 [Puccinia striiformis f. sp. tritici PST-78]
MDSPSASPARNQQPGAGAGPQRSFSVSSLSQNAYYHLYHSLPSTPARLSLPLHRTSIVDQATSTHSNHQILLIAIKKLLVVFASVHSVVSAASFALALIRRRRASARGEKRSILKVIKTVWTDDKIIRLSGFLGSYSALWTLTFPGLSKLRSQTEPTTTKNESLLDSYRRLLSTFLSDWAAALSGAVAGLALLAQTKQERLNLAPNLFCRGLYTLLKYKPIMNFPYGDLILFGISNTQIMSAFVLNPSTLPTWYWHWIRRVGSLETRFLDLHRLLNRGEVRDMKLIHQVIDLTSHNRTLKNQTRLRDWLSGSINPLLAPAAPCHFNHPNSDSCVIGNGLRTWSAFKSMVPTYAILHLVPALLFRSKVFIKSPIKFLISILRKTTSSALFLATFVWIILFSVCIPSRVYEWSKGTILLRGTKWNGIVGFATAFSLLWEDPRRRGELALYCAPKALASIWQVLKAKGLVKSLKYGEIMIGSLGTGMLMHCFVHAPSSMPALIRGTLGQLIDPHFPGRQSDIIQSKMKAIDCHTTPPPPNTTTATTTTHDLEQISYFGVLENEVQINLAQQSSSSM